MKKILSFALALVLAVGLRPNTARAASALNVQKHQYPDVLLCKLGAANQFLPV